MVKTAEILEALAEGRDLGEAEAEAGFEALMAGNLSAGQAGAFLMGLRAKGETPLELAAAVKKCLEKARLVPGLTGKRIDTCGTGGDARSSFNCSTATAMVLASMGYDVVKHGNRSVSSKSGSADIIEALGMPLSLEPEEVPAKLAENHFVFLFAPNFHPAFKHVMPIRKDLGIRTLFNLLGPLLNPARPTHQLLGVAKAELAPLVADTLARTDITRAAVVHGAGGYDELTPFGDNLILLVENGEVRKQPIDAEDLGLSGGKDENVTVSGPEEAIEVVKELLDGRGPIVMQHMIILNLAVALWLLEESMALEQAVMEARGALMSGQAARHFGIY